MQHLALLVGHSWVVMRQVSAVKWCWARALAVHRCRQPGQES